MKISTKFVVVVCVFCVHLPFTSNYVSSHCRNYAWLMLAAVRALVEQQPVEEDYSKFEYVFSAYLKN